MVGWLCLASHRQRGHLKSVPQFTVPCERREVRFLHRSTGIEPRAVTWQSITQPLRHASSIPDWKTFVYENPKYASYVDLLEINHKTLWVMNHYCFSYVSCVF